MAALESVGGVARRGPFTGGGQSVPETRSVSPDLSRQLAQPVTGGGVVATYGPYHFSTAYNPGEILGRPSSGAPGGSGGSATTGVGGAPSGVGSDLTRGERPASELQIRSAPQAQPFAGPSLESINELIQRLAAGGNLGASRGSDFNVSPGDGAGGGNDPTGPLDTGALRAAQSEFFESEGKKLNPLVRTLLDLALPLATKIPLPLGRIIDFARERLTDPHRQALEAVAPRGSSPSPDGSPGGPDPGATPPGGTAPPGLTAAQGAVVADMIGPFGPLATPQGQDLTVAFSDDPFGEPGTAPQGEQGEMGHGEPGTAPGGESGDTSDGGLGDGSGASGPGGDGAWHRGGYVKRGPPRGPERRGVLMEKEYVVKAKAVKLHRGLLEAINRGAPKAELRRLVEAGR